MTNWAQTARTGQQPRRSKRQAANETQTLPNAIHVCALAVGPGSELGQLLVSAFYNGTKPGLSLTSITTVARYGRILQIVTRSANLDKLGVSPHSPRVGWASEARLAGVPFTEVQEAGR